MEHGLNFFSTLIWQLILVAILYYSRSEIKILFRKIVKIKFQDTEIEFQEESASILESPSIAKEILEIRDEAGFFTKEGVFGLVNKSKYVEENEKSIDALLAFNTKRQRTWLIKTSRQVFFILDDESTRSTQSLIQKKINLDDISTIKTKQESELSGIFEIENTGWWYYSLTELGTPAVAKRKLIDFLGK